MNSTFRWNRLDQTVRKQLGYVNKRLVSMKLIAAVSPRRKERIVPARSFGGPLLTSGATRFMVPMRAKDGVEAFHKPLMNSFWQARLVIVSLLLASFACRRSARNQLQSALLPGLCLLLFIPSFPARGVGTNYQIKEIFAYNVSAGTGDQNITAFDNITYTLEVPEPSPILLTAIGVVALGVVLRRVRRVER